MKHIKGSVKSIVNGLEVSGDGLLGWIGWICSMECLC
jgi:hypothetical protein